MNSPHLPPSPLSRIRRLIVAMLIAWCLLILLVWCVVQVTRKFFF